MPYNGRMKKILDRIRKPKKSSSRGSMLRDAVLLALLGIALGVFAKYLDELALDDRIWWHLPHRRNAGR